MGWSVDGVWVVAVKTKQEQKKTLFITRSGFFYAKRVEPWSRWAAATEDYTGCQSR